MRQSSPRVCGSWGSAALLLPAAAEDLVEDNMSLSPVALAPGTSSGVGLAAASFDMRPARQPTAHAFSHDCSKWSDDPGSETTFAALSGNLKADASASACGVPVELPHANQQPL